jgi:cytoskeletal protein RodZ
MAAENGGSRFTTTVLIISCVISLAIGAFAFYLLVYWGTSEELAARDTQLVVANSQVSTLNAKVSSLQNDLTAAKASIASLNGTVALLQEEVVAANAYYDANSALIANATATIASLKSENTRLQRAIDMKDFSVVADSITVHQVAGAVSNVISFNANYAGYIVVSATSSAPSGYALVTDDNPNFAAFDTIEYPILSGSSFSVPVLPGTVGVFLGNREKINEYNGTFTVTYYY